MKNENNVNYGLMNAQTAFQYKLSRTTEVPFKISNRIISPFALCKCKEKKIHSVIQEKKKQTNPDSAASPTSLTYALGNHPL